MTTLGNSEGPTLQERGLSWSPVYPLSTHVLNQVLMPNNHLVNVQLACLKNKIICYLANPPQLDAETFFILFLQPGLKCISKEGLALVCHKKL